MSEKGIVHLRCAEIRVTKPPAASEFPPKSPASKPRAKDEEGVKKMAGASFCRKNQRFGGQVFS
jgi:hypothetical protein